jgi:hypothetical protein
MEQQVRMLIENMGCEEGSARLALAICDNNADEAMKNFESLMSDVSIIKAKFKSSITGVTGLFILIANNSEKRIIRLGVIVTNDSLVYETDLNGNWFVFERKIYTIRLGNKGSLQNATQEIEQHLFNNLQDDLGKDFYDVLKNSDSKDIKNFLYDLISKVQFLPKLKLDIKIDKMSRPYNKNKTKPIAYLKDDDNSIQSGSQIELEVNLTKGDKKNSMPAKLLVKGDMVMAEVIDERDVATYISKLLGGLKQDKYVPLFSVVESLTYEKNYILVKVRFSPGITGISYIHPNDDIRIVRDRPMILFRKIKKIFS